jgi:cell division septum initiation protein DivIVA
MNAEKILEGLTQEERLKLLEQLIQGAEQAQEEELSLEDRVDRLETVIFAAPHRRSRHGHGPHGRHGQHRRHHHMGGCGCGCG